MNFDHLKSDSIVSNEEMLKHPREYLKKLAYDAFHEMGISLEKMSDDDCRTLLETLLMQAANDSMEM